MDRSLLILVLAAGAACGGSDDVVAFDAAPDGPSACTDFTTAELGRCADVGGALCTNFAEGNHFVPIATGETINMIQGFQGSPMIAMAVSTTGIDGNDGGDAENNPAVTASILDEGGLLIASYLGNVAFIDTPGSPGTVEMPSLFLIINTLPDDVAGMMVHASVSISDRNGVRRCGELDFVAGAIEP